MITTNTKDILFENILKIMDVTLNDIQSRNRKSHLVDARCMLAAWLKKMPCVRQKNIAKLFGTSQAAVSYMLNRHKNLVDFNIAYRNKWNMVNQTINLKQNKI